jgi:hypothetical protein
MDKCHWGYCTKIGLAIWAVNSSSLTNRFSLLILSHKFKEFQYEFQDNPELYVGNTCFVGPVCRAYGTLNGFCRSFFPGLKPGANHV